MAAKELTLVEILAMIKESKIFLLKYNGKVMGLRVKIFDKDITDFYYYDIGLDTVSNNQDIRDFVNKTQKSFGTMELKAHNGALMTQDEIDGTMQIRSFPNEGEAVTILTRLMGVYGYKYVLPDSQ